MISCKPCISNTSRHRSTRRKTAPRQFKSRLAHHRKILESLVLSRIFLFLESADPYLDPLCFCHTMDVLIHSVCAFTFHAVCGVSVHIKGKRRGLMSEILLHRLDVIAGLQAVYGVSMPLRYNYDKPEKPRITRVLVIWQGFSSFSKPKNRAAK